MGKLLHLTLISMGVLLSIVSCVPNKKLVYLQNEDFKGKLNYDTILNVYEQEYTEYTLGPGDIVGIRIGSVTPAEFNFIKQYEEQLGVLRKLYQYEQNDKSGSQGSQGRIANNQVNQDGLSGAINQFTADQFLSGFALDDQGKLALPKIGQVELNGLTLTQAEGLIQDSLQGFFETPIVRMQMMSFHFSVFGEVNTEGRFTAYDTRTTIFDAIALAGNLTEFANRERIKLVRYDDGVGETAFINMLDESLIESKYYFLRPGDQLIVPPLKARQTTKYVIPNITLFLSIAAAALGIAVLINSLQ